MRVGPPPGDPRVALQFLTRLPAGRPAHTADLTGASAWFPAVGLIVAGVGIAVRAGLEPWLGPVTATIVAVTAMIVATGAFHEDGLADTADGIWGGCTVDQRLAIMRDSRIGTFGTLALVTDTALRIALLAQLDLVDFVRAVACAHVLGRLTPLLLVAGLRPARDGGQGTRAHAPGLIGWMLALAVVTPTAIMATGRWAALVAGALVVGVAAVGVVAWRKLGGVTGDVLGAGVQIAGLTITATVAGLARAEVWA